MKPYRYPDYPKDSIKRVITIGNFDGVHLGHQFLIKCLVEQAQNMGENSMIVTFHPHPLEILDSRKDPFLITTLEEKMNCFDEMGVDECLIIPFDEEFSLVGAEEFLIDILFKNLHFSMIIVGENHYFGYQKSGDFEFAQKLGNQYGFKVTQFSEKYQPDQQKINSTIIRSSLKNAQMDLFKNLTGRFFKISGKVIRGQKRGAAIGYSTANIAINDKICPKMGVYAVKISVNEQNYYGMANIGVRPTFGDSSDKPLLEVHIFDFNETLYGKEIEVFFIQFIRDEKKFISSDKLHEQIQSDEIEIRKIFS